MFRLLVTGLFCATLLSACHKQDADPAHDYFSFANSGQFLTRHLELDLDVDFDRQQLSGSARLHMQSIDPDARTVVLDSRGLQVTEIRFATDRGEPQVVPFEFGEEDAVKGRPLRIQLPAGFDSEAEFDLTVSYSSGPEASAIMWLPARLTAGKRYPFMFTQSQSIHARSWVPVQDTPAVRFTYAATIRTPPELLALMSADNDPLAERSGTYHFSMPQPIPSYLLALVVGNVFFETLGPDTGVYAEPEVLAASAWEFADTQAMLEAAERLYGPYKWGRYDLLILPPSFPFGGMENPRLSFITPSVLAGDRSLVSMIAHELAHSWSGNLVSNASWRDIWLNEGTTSYLESRLMEDLYGKERADEERLLAYQALLESLNTVPLPMQALAPVFESGDPDVGQDGLEYAKGQLLLENLEAAFGRPQFDAFMQGYFTHYGFQAISTEQWLDYIDENLLQAEPGRFSRALLEEWLYQPGIPADTIVPASKNLDDVAVLANRWARGEVPTPFLPHDHWSPQATVYFINSLPEVIDPAQLAVLDSTLGLSTAGNSEIARAWFIQAATRQYRPAYAHMQQYLLRNGRTRLIKPVYQALVANGADGEFARWVFDLASGSYHPLTRAAIEVHLQRGPVTGQGEDEG